MQPSDIINFFFAFALDGGDGDIVTRTHTLPFSGGGGGDGSPPG